MRKDGWKGGLLFNTSAVVHSRLTQDRDTLRKLREMLWLKEPKGFRGCLHSSSSYFLSISTTVQTFWFPRNLRILAVCRGNQISLVMSSKHTQARSPYEANNTPNHLPHHTQWINICWTQMHRNSSTLPPDGGIADPGAMKSREAEQLTHYKVTDFPHSTSVFLHSPPRLPFPPFLRPFGASPQPSPVS